MGYYIQVPDHKGKARQIVDLYGAEYLEKRPLSFADIPHGKALICVVQNPLFDAVAFVHDELEFKEFSNSYDTRLKTWLLMDLSRAKELSGFPTS